MFERATDVQIHGGSFKDISGNLTEYHGSVHNVNSYNNTSTHTTGSYNNSSTRDNRKSNKHFNYAGPINMMNGVVQHGGKSLFQQKRPSEGQVVDLAAHDRFTQQNKALQQAKAAIRMLQENSRDDSSGEDSFNSDMRVKDRKDKSNEQWKGDGWQEENRKHEQSQQQQSTASAPPANPLAYIPQEHTPSRFKPNNPFGAMTEAELLQARQSPVHSPWDV